MTNPSPRNSGNDLNENEIQSGMDSQTIALRIIAGLLILGAISLMSKLFVPFILALVLAIAFTPVAGRIERLGLPRAVGALACMGVVALLLISVTSLLAYQLGNLVDESDELLDQLRERFTQGAESIGGEQLLSAMGLIEEKTKPDQAMDSPIEPDVNDSEFDFEDVSNRFESHGEPSDRSSQESDNQQDAREDEEGQEDEGFWGSILQSNLEAISGWIFNGIGGLVGIIGQLVILLAFLFFMLLTREEWSDRILRAAVHLGFHPRHETLEGAQHKIGQFFGYVFLVACTYGVIVTLLGWGLDLPSPAAWGVLAGLAMFIPYIGPIITGTMLTLVALASGDGLWKPAVALGVYVLLQTIESYAITPFLYGRAVAFNPVMVLFGVLFFGWLLGPLGLITALPAMVLLRAVVQTSTDTPALHALLDKKQQEAQPSES